MAKAGESKKKRKKVKEKEFKLNKTRSLFYPSQYGGNEEAAYEGCASQAAEKDVFWDENLQAWYYYF